MGCSPPPCPALLCDPGETPPQEEVGALPSLPRPQSPAAMSTPFSSTPNPSACLTWSGYRTRGQTCRAGVPGTGGSHVSSLGSGLFTRLPRRLGEGPSGEERTLNLKGPHPEVPWGWEGRVSRHRGLSPDPPWLTWPFSGAVGTPPWCSETSVLSPVTLPG